MWTKCTYGHLDERLDVGHGALLPSVEAHRRFLTDESGSSVDNLLRWTRERAQIYLVNMFISDQSHYNNPFKNNIHK
jgi:hypothetical protein